MDQNGLYNIPLRVKATDKTPSFEYIPKQGTFNIKGVSIPVDAKAFYNPIFDWLSGFVEVQDPNSYLIINISLDYFSPSSIMHLIKIFKKLEKFDNASINWYYEDDELLEAGTELSTILHIKFNMIKY